jgi:hypothetical protein
MPGVKEVPMALATLGLPNEPMVCRAEDAIIARQLAELVGSPGPEYMYSTVVRITSVQHSILIMHRQWGEERISWFFPFFAISPNRAGGRTGKAGRAENRT